MVDSTLLGISIFHVVMGSIFWLWAIHNTNKSGLPDSGMFIFALMISTGGVGLSNAINGIGKGEYLYQVHLDMLLATHIILLFLHIVGVFFHYGKLREAKAKGDQSGQALEAGTGGMSMAEKREIFFNHEPNMRRKIGVFIVFALIWFTLGMVFYQLLL